MPDQLYLSLWVRGFDERNMLRHFAQLLHTFPFSAIRPGVSALRIYAIEATEPPLFERSYAAPPPIEEIIQPAREFENPDCLYMADAWWEVWRYKDQWTLTPAPVSLCCFGPHFENDVGDNLRIELGADADFLPQPGLPETIAKVRSNVTGLLRLTREARSSLPLVDLRLWTESGENFAERLDEALSEKLDE
jgi:hypothetical protein